MPHVWLDDGRSTVDVAALEATWLLGPEAPAEDGARLSPEAAARCGLGSAGAMLVRPDGFVAEVY